jgi:thiol-disulfide isomerase/thioredoxin
VQPKSAVAAFAAFRLLGANYAAKMIESTKPAEVAKVQTWWKDELEGYAKTFPNAEETPEALFRLGMPNEFSGKDGEAAAKQWYAALAKNFPSHPLAAQSAGAVNRLDIEGKPLNLTGNALSGQTINIASLKGNVTLVYFWASWSKELKDDSQYLTDLAKKHGGKINIVTVCMDADAKTAQQAVAAVSLPGVHLFAPGNALANQYGVMGRHIVLIAKDGMVSNKNGQFPMVADEVEKLVK